jgi:hypothetical protein
MLRRQSIACSGRSLRTRMTHVYWITDLAVMKAPK